MEDYQGKREDQVEGSLKMFTYSIVIIIAAIVLMVIFG